MFQRFARAMSQVKGHAALARELSAGLLEAVASVVRIHPDYDAVLAAHDRDVASQLPGF